MRHVTKYNSAIKVSDNDAGRTPEVVKIFCVVICLD